MAIALLAALIMFALFSCIGAMIARAHATAADDDATLTINTTPALFVVPHAFGPITVDDEAVHGRDDARSIFLSLPSLDSWSSRSTTIENGNDDDGSVDENNAAHTDAWRSRAAPNRAHCSSTTPSSNESSSPAASACSWSAYVIVPCLPSLRDSMEVRRWTVEWADTTDDDRRSSSSARRMRARLDSTRSMLAEAHLVDADDDSVDDDGRANTNATANTTANVRSWLSLVRSVQDATGADRRRHGGGDDRGGSDDGGGSSGNDRTAGAAQRSRLRGRSMRHRHARTARTHARSTRTAAATAYLIVNITLIERTTTMANDGGDDDDGNATPWIAPLVIDLEATLNYSTLPGLQHALGARPIDSSTRESHKTIAATATMARRDANDATDGENEKADDVEEELGGGMRATANGDDEVEVDADDASIGALMVDASDDDVDDVDNDLKKSSDEASVDDGDDGEDAEISAEPAHRAQRLACEMATGGACATPLNTSSTTTARPTTSPTHAEQQRATIRLHVVFEASARHRPRRRTAPNDEDDDALTIVEHPRSQRVLVQNRKQRIVRVRAEPTDDLVIDCPPLESASNRTTGMRADERSAGCIVEVVARSRTSDGDGGDTQPRDESRASAIWRRLRDAVENDDETAADDDNAEDDNRGQVVDEAAVRRQRRFEFERVAMVLPAHAWLNVRTGTLRLSDAAWLHGFIDIDDDAVLEFDHAGSVGEEHDASEGNTRTSVIDVQRSCAASRATCTRHAFVRNDGLIRVTRGRVIVRSPVRGRGRIEVSEGAELVFDWATIARRETEIDDEKRAVDGAIANDDDEDDTVYRLYVAHGSPRGSRAANARAALRVRGTLVFAQGSFVVHGGLHVGAHDDDRNRTALAQHSSAADTRVGALVVSSRATLALHPPRSVDDGRDKSSGDDDNDDEGTSDAFHNESPTCARRVSHTLGGREIVLAGRLDVINCTVLLAPNVLRSTSLFNITRTGQVCARLTDRSENAVTSAEQMVVASADEMLRPAWVVEGVLDVERGRVYVRGALVVAPDGHLLIRKRAQVLLDAAQRRADSGAAGDDEAIDDSSSSQQPRQAALSPRVFDRFDASTFAPAQARQLPSWLAWLERLHADRTEVGHGVGLLLGIEWVLEGVLRTHDGVVLARTRYVHAPGAQLLADGSSMVMLMSRARAAVAARNDEPSRNDDDDDDDRVAVIRACAHGVVCDSWSDEGASGLRIDRGMHVRVDQSARATWTTVQVRGTLEFALDSQLTVRTFRQHGATSVTRLHGLSGVYVGLDGADGGDGDEVDCEIAEGLVEGSGAIEGRTVVVRAATLRPTFVNVTMDDTAAARLRTSPLSAIAQMMREMAQPGLLLLGGDVRLSPETTVDVSIESAQHGIPLYIGGTCAADGVLHISGAVTRDVAEAAAERKERSISSEKDGLGASAGEGDGLADAKPQRLAVPATPRDGRANGIGESVLGESVLGESVLGESSLRITLVLARDRLSGRFARIDVSNLAVDRTYFVHSATSPRVEYEAQQVVLVVDKAGYKCHRGDCSNAGSDKNGDAISSSAMRTAMWNRRSRRHQHRHDLGSDLHTADDARGSAWWTFVMNSHALILRALAVMVLVLHA